MTSVRPAPDSTVHTWNAADDIPAHEWYAEFDHSLGTGPVSAWQELVLGLTDRYRLARIARVDELGYRRRRDGPLARFLRDHPDRVPARDQLPAGLLLGAHADYESTARISYLAPDGQLAETDVTSADELSQRLRTADRPGSGSPMLSMGASTGHPARQPQVTCTIAVATDIWFPWTWRTYQPGPRDEPMENRILARRNGLRLNLLLVEARALTLELGGRWGTAFPYRYPEGYELADGLGIALDAPPPLAPPPFSGS